MKSSILFLIGSYDSFGGTEKVTTALANALAARGHRVALGAFRGRCDPKLLGLNDDCGGQGADRPTGGSVRCFDLEKVSLRKVLIENKIDVIINQWCLPFFVTRRINAA